MTEYKLTIPGTSVTFEMVPIPGGKFKMGSPDGEEGRQENEGPQFDVDVSPFWMSKYELTWAEYRQYMALYGIFKEFTRAEIGRSRPRTKSTPSPLPRNSTIRALPSSTARTRTCRRSP